jgi:uncharacterized protein DUF6851
MGRILALFVACALAACQPGPTAGPSQVAVASPSPRPTATPLPSPKPTADPTIGVAGCTPPENPTWSVARRWDEALLDAIRRALPNPPVHARNLFHLSVAMWDAWATYDPNARGYFTTAKVSTSDVERARREAISFAAWAVLTERFEKAAGGEDSLAEFTDVLTSLCYQPELATSARGDDPAAVGTRIAQAVIAQGLGDNSNEAHGYKAPGYKPVNSPLVVSSSKRFSLVDPNRWQPLEIIGGFSQNGIATGTVQVAVGPHWGAVHAFGTTPGTGVLIDPGPPPRLGDPVTDSVLKQDLVEVIRDSSMLDPRQKVTIDISPAARGGNDLATNDGYGYAINPVTNLAYVPQVVKRADFLRASAEFWADGPRSETPPGHWNVIANDASDAVVAKKSSLLIGGAGQPVDRLEWDVKLYFAINGAVHNAAIASWGLKGRYDSVRPITLIRYMGGLGQSSDPSGPSYDARGLPLVPGLIEVITAQSSAPGQRHQKLAKYVGRIAIRAWGGSPRDPSTQIGGTRWMLATAWVPYQLPSFVTPSFPAYVSGHSTFSRSAAEVLTAFTGSSYFPTGLARYTIPAGGLSFEHGPTTDVDLEWATYFDAADQAGQSRLFGGIHIRADDFTGRRIGSACGRAAWQLADQYYAGAAEPAGKACAPAG